MPRIGPSRGPMLSPKHERRPDHRAERTASPVIMRGVGQEDDGSPSCLSELATSPKPRGRWRGTRHDMRHPGSCTRWRFRHARATSAIDRWSLNGPGEPADDVKFRRSSDPRSYLSPVAAHGSRGSSSLDRARLGHGRPCTALGAARRSRPPCPLRSAAPRAHPYRESARKQSPEPVAVAVRSHAAVSASSCVGCCRRIAAVARVPASKHVGFCATIMLRIFTCVASKSDCMESSSSSS